MIELGKLNELYKQADDHLRGDFAKMRSSLLLIAGEHYNKRSTKNWDRIRSTKQLSNEAKLRLTKNHIGKITRRYSNIIMATAPGVVVSPANEKELRDQKAAELNQSVWAAIKQANDWVNMNMGWCDDFVGIGEVWTKCYYDPSAGSVIGYEQAVNEFGAPIVDEMGQPVSDESKPVYEGMIKYEEIYAFNVLTDPAAKNVKKSSWYCIRKMVNIDDLKQEFPDKAEKIQQSEDETFMVFDLSSGYRESNKKECMVKEWHFRPCAKYPKGYWVMQISSVKLAEGEYPEDEEGPIFPIICQPFDTIQTKCRGYAVTEPLRPYQAEINRSASKIAEHQITLGDDKLILQNGAKVSAGTQLPGIRSVTVSGAAPTILAGRSGSQYVEYMLSQIDEMYKIADLEEDDKMDGQLDPHTLLYRAASQKKKFKRYIQRFESFLKEVCEVGLRMAKVLMPDQAVIAAVGSSEAVNIAEFKRASRQGTMITVEPQSDDVETKLGRQLTFHHILQYVGNQLDPGVIGKMIRDMPYANNKDAFSDLTIDDENATNDILALDRGEMPEVNQHENHEYIISRVTSRMKQADYKRLDPQIQQMYEAFLEEHMRILREQKMAVQREQQGLIPASGTLIGVDFYLPDPQNPDRTRRARIPYDAVEWLVTKLDEQAGILKMAESVPMSAIAATQQQGDVQAPQAMPQELL